MFDFSQSLLPGQKNSQITFSFHKNEELNKSNQFPNHFFNSQTPLNKSKTQSYSPVPPPCNPNRHASPPTLITAFPQAPISREPRPSTIATFSFFLFFLFFFYINIIKNICQLLNQNLTNSKFFSIIFIELRKKGVNT